MALKPYKQGFTAPSTPVQQLLPAPCPILRSADDAPAQLRASAPYAPLLAGYARCVRPPLLLKSRPALAVASHARGLRQYALRYFAPSALVLPVSAWLQHDAVRHAAGLRRHAVGQTRDLPFPYPGLCLLSLSFLYPFPGLYPYPLPYLCPAHTGPQLLQPPPRQPLRPPRPPPQRLLSLPRQPFGQPLRSFSTNPYLFPGPDPDPVQKQTWLPKQGPASIQLSFS